MHRRNISVHGKNSIADYDAMPAASGCGLCGKIVHVGMAKNNNIRSGKTAGINNTGMIQLIAENDIAFSTYRRNNTGICVIAGIEQQRLFTATKSGNGFFKFHMFRPCACDKT